MGVDTVVAWIGLDWADQRYAGQLQTADGTVEAFVLEQTPAALHEWVAQSASGWARARWLSLWSNARARSFTRY